MVAVPGSPGEMWGDIDAFVPPGQREAGRVPQLPNVAK